MKLTEDNMYTLCANKSIEEIENMRDNDVKQQAIRYYFSRLLADHDENNPLETNICLETKEDMGLSSLDKLWITKLSQTPCEGYINIWIEGTEDWSDIDILDNETQILILKEIIK